MSTPTDLSASVTKALRRAAKRIDSYTSCDQAGMVDILTEELRPVLLGGPLAEVPAREGGSSVAGRLVNVPVNWSPTEPRVYRLIQCRHKVNATSGCTACWSCAKCGRSGCGNMLDWREGDELRTEVCPRDSEP